MMNLIVGAYGLARLGNRDVRCALGRAGISRCKREGDGATPVGGWNIRGVFYRADRVAPPDTCFPSRRLAPNDAWCDDPQDKAYNQLVRLPYIAGTEMLWREDRIYDLIVQLGYNDSPAVPELGSAIFLHIAKPDYAPTRGCIAMMEGDLRFFLQHAELTSRVVVLP